MLHSDEKAYYSVFLVVFISKKGQLLTKYFFGIHSLNFPANVLFHKLVMSYTYSHFSY